MAPWAEWRILADARELCDRSDMALIGPGVAVRRGDSGLGRRVRRMPVSSRSAALWPGPSGAPAPSQGGVNRRTARPPCRLRRRWPRRPNIRIAAAVPLWRISAGQCGTFRGNPYGPGTW